MAGIIKKEFDIQRVITSKVIHSASSLKQKEAMKSLKHQLDVSTIPIPEANSDLKKEKDSYLNSLMTSIEIDYSNSDVDNINSNTKFVGTKLVKSETFVDVSQIKPDKLDFSIEESNNKTQIKTDPLEVPKTVNKPNSAKETNSRLKGEEICSQCGMRFVNKEKLIFHNIVTHSKPRIKLQRIDNIPQIGQAAGIKNVKQPSLPINKGEKMHQCQVCDDVFKNKSTLKNHIISIHDGKEYLECPRILKDQMASVH